MVGEQHLPFVLYAVSIAVLLAQGSQAISFKAGKINITVKSPGLFACETIRFAESFSGGKQVKVFAAFGHSVNNQARGNGASIWVESEDRTQFRACIYEYSNGSNSAAEINWLALQSAPKGAQLGTTSLDSWTTGTECKKIVFPQGPLTHSHVFFPYLKRFATPPIVLATPSHQFPERPQDAMAVWVEELTEDSFKICLREVKIFDGIHKGITINWMAYTNLRVDNFTLSDSLVFTSNNSPSQQIDYAFCQKLNFTDQFYAPPVVMVTAERVNNDSHLSGCNAFTAWVEYTSTADTEICVRTYDAKSKPTIKVDYLIIGDLDPCIDVLCDYHGLCKAFGPYDARCVCIDSCPQYQEPVCSSNGTTYDNTCLFKQEMCLLQLNYTVQHPGSCEGFPFQRDRRHMPHIPSLGYSHCEVIRFQPFVFYPDKPIQVQITVNHIDTSDMNYVHDAAVSWIEDVTYEQFTACVMAAGYNERKSLANVSIDWVAYQGAPVGGVTGEVRMSQWWTGTTCKTVNFPSFSKEPSVFVTAAHHHAGLKRDAASIWLEDISLSSFKLCLRELQNYAGSHEDIYVNWLAFLFLHKPLFSEHSSIYFPNSQSPGAWNNNAFCRDISFSKVYKNAPSVFVSANHTSSGGGLDPVHNSITAWVEYINTTGARVCLKELHESKYDPLSVSYTVLSDICQPRWSYFGGYCYFTSRACASWLTAESNCSTMSSNLVTVHNQEENVYIQHRHNGERSWIGLNDRSVEGSFVWTNKEISSFRFWAPQQPNDWKNEDCVHTLGAKHGYAWNDVPCHNCYNYTCFKDLDECTTGSDSCDVNSVCQNTVGSYTCSCNAGYTGDGKPCNDIDECSTNSHSCGANAVCSNTAGSYTCACKAGFTGDGKTCSDIDECSTNSHSCDVNAVCSNNVGSYACACKAGFTGDGYTCTDIDECAHGTHNCHSSLASCTNTVGSFSCSCSSPYIGDGKTCINIPYDLDECTTASHSCDVNSVCQNNAGSYTCSCNAGYTGDGKTCNDIDECSSNAHSCGVNAVCNNTVGSYACTCKAGYSGDGRTCTDIDECASGTDDCHSSRALCTNTVGSFNCSCNSSYIGDGRICNLPSDIDECTSSVPLCDVNATCTNNDGSYICICKNGFSGDGKTCKDIDESSTSSYSSDVNAVCSNSVGCYA
ncbi:unnamed protein product [Porites lobata]|uniref:Uncharacterized protein n=1 Tax=Porites lobata TaxID=104759 RepID=A0ABN8RA00_9CNID|nr:unnamed protein product [Porites lobata]